MSAKLFVIFLALSNEAIAFSSLLSFVGMLVLHYDPTLSRADAGTYSGFVVAIYQFAQIFFNKGWGSMSDRFGRRRPLLCGMLFGIISNLLFGLCNSLWQALLCRALMGIMNGNNVILKTVIADLAREIEEEQQMAVVETERKEQEEAGDVAESRSSPPVKNASAKLFAVMNATWNGSAALSPMISGLLYGRGGKLFESHPALLPMLVVVVYNIVSLVLVFFFLPETNHKFVQQTRLAEDAEGDAAAATSAVEMQEAVEGEAAVYDGAGADDHDADGEEEEEGKVEVVVVSSGSPGKASRAGSRKIKTAGDDSSSSSGDPESFGYLSLFRPEYATLARMNAAYVVCCAAQIVVTENVPLLALLPVDHKGYGWNPDKIGSFIFTVQGVAGFASTFFIGPLADNLPGGKLQLLRCSFYIWALTLPLFPPLAGLSQPLPMLPLLWALIATRAAVTTAAFTCSTSGVATAAPKSAIGAVTGISHSCGNIARAIFPVISTPLFAWSVAPTNSQSELLDIARINSSEIPADVTIRQKPFPFNVYFIFLLASLLTLVGPLVLRPLLPDDLHPPASPASSPKLPVVSSASKFENGDEDLVDKVDAEEANDGEDDAGIILMKRRSEDSS